MIRARFPSRRPRRRPIPSGPGRILRRYGGFLFLAGLMIAALFAKVPYDDIVDTITGAQARVMDGDSFRLGGEEIRLLGIDAPELHQACHDERGRDWACGQEARAKLRALIGRSEVRCEARTHDRFGRALARCGAGDIADLGEAMVRQGFAVNDFNGGYERAEAQARADKRGLWRGPFERPRDWRRQNPRTDAP